MDHFGRLPDSLVLVIFEKVADARSLVRCLAVSKRFSSLVPLVHDVFLKIDWPAAVEDGLVFEALSPPLPNNPDSLLILLTLMLSATYKNYQYFPDANVDDDDNKTLSARQALRNFTHVRNLKIELPPYSPGGGDLVTRDGQVLKWRVEFGSTLQSCLLVAATGMEDRNSVASAINQVAGGINGSLHDTFFANSEPGEKLRSGLGYGAAMFASMRHYQLVPIIMDHPTLRSVVFTDADGVGTLIMGEEQLKDCRENPPQTVPALNSTYKRTWFPTSACRAKSTCARELELPGGLGRHKAAAIVVCKPIVQSDVTTINEQVEELLVSGAFEGHLVHVAKALLRKRN